MNEQAILTAIAQNLKRLVKFLNQPPKSIPNQGEVRIERTFYRLVPVYLPLLMLISYASRLLTNSTSGYLEKLAIQIT